MILLVVTCHGNGDKHRLDGPLGSTTDWPSKFKQSILHCSGRILWSPLLNEHHVDVQAKISIKQGATFHLCNGMLK